MVDVFSKRKRSEIMSRVRSHENKRTELTLIRIFRTYRITGWRRNQPVFGKPDFVFRHGKVAIFVDGCFWHCCPKHSTVPESNRDFWLQKLSRNHARDIMVNATLKDAGWKVIRLWQHDLTQKDEKKVVARIRRILSAV